MIANITRFDTDVEATGTLLESRVGRWARGERKCSISALRFLPQLLDAVRALPEEQVGADRRAQHRDQQGDVIPRERRVRHDRVERDL
jgi:hypothetical protein